MQLLASEEAGRSLYCSPALLLWRNSGVVVLRVALELEKSQEKCEEVYREMVE